MRIPIPLIAVACFAAGAALSAPVRQIVPVVRGLQVIHPKTGAVLPGKFIAGMELGSDADAPVAMITCDRIGDRVKICYLVDRDKAAEEGFVVSRLQ